MFFSEQITILNGSCIAVFVIQKISLVQSVIMYTEEKQPRIKSVPRKENIMKREVIENLLKGLGVTDDKVKEAVDTIMTENGNDIERYKISETNLKIAA